MNTGYKIQVENSAPSQHKPAKSVLWSSPILHKIGVQSIVDLGCGRLRNLDVFRKYFSKIDLVDTKLQCERILRFIPKSKRIRLLTIKKFKSDKRRYDAIFLISVLHVIDKPAIRRHLLSLTRLKLYKPGFLIVDVPTGEHYYRQNCTKQNEHGDGWVMGKGSIRTFYKNFYAKEFDKLVFSCTRFKLYKTIYFDKHLIRIWSNSS